MSRAEIHRQKELQATWENDREENHVGTGKRKIIRTNSQGRGIQCHSRNLSSSLHPPAWVPLKQGLLLHKSISSLRVATWLFSSLLYPGDYHRAWHRVGAQKCLLRTSLVAQWLQICLPMQGTRVRALVQEDPTCRGATKPVHHNYWACTLEPASHNYWAHVPQLLKPTRLEPVLHNKRSHGNEKPAHCKEEWPRLTATGESHTQQQRTKAAKSK